MSYFSNEKIRDLSFSILSSCLSQPNIDKLYRENKIQSKYRDPDIMDKYLTYFDSSFMENLISFASIIRASDDHKPYLDEFSKKLSCSVKIIKNISNTKAIDTKDLRESCNKIIHARDIQYMNKYVSEHPLHNDINKNDRTSYLNPDLILKGKYNNSEWEVIVHIIPFVVYSVEAFESS